MLKNWNKLPEYMRTDEVRPYYDLLQKDTLNKLGYKAKINTHTTSYIN